MKYIIGLIAIGFFLSCAEKELSGKEDQRVVVDEPFAGTSLIVLGTVQDAGSPQIGCKKECCASLFEHPDASRKVVSLGLIDSENKKTYLFEATPDVATQVEALQRYANSPAITPDGIFLSHAHIGHYTGLMYLGKEATNASRVPVYAMPRMQDFLEQNGPWSQLVLNNNIVLLQLASNKEIALSNKISVIPLQVPHRDEFSETVGFKIIGPNKSALFIPDIDKWDLWERSIVDEIAEVDYAFIDATFYDGLEINSRDISQIPHPFVIESMAKFASLPSEEKGKIYFIHFNHTNPLLNQDSEAYKKVVSDGFKIATSGMSISL